MILIQNTIFKNNFFDVLKVCAYKPFMTHFTCMTCNRGKLKCFAAFSVNEAV